MENKPHKDLNVWKKSIDLTVKVYEITRSFPQHEQFGITFQMRKSALSIASNIAEGAARQTKKEFIQFLHVAQGSLSELDTQFENSRMLGYVTIKNCEEIIIVCIEISKMLTGLIKSLKKP